MSLRILTGVLVPKKLPKGVAKISFYPHEVTGDASGNETEESGSSGKFKSRPGKLLSIREFWFEDKDTFFGGAESEFFKINDSTWNEDYLVVRWECAKGAVIHEISYLIVGET